MERAPSSVSHGTKFELDSRTDRVRATTSTQSINQDSICDDKGCSRDLLWSVEVDETYLGGQWKTNEKRFGTREQNEDEGPRNNRCSGSSVAMVLSGLKLLMTLKLTLFKLSSHKKYQWVLLSVPIPGKLTPESLHEGISIVSLITVKDNTLMEKEIISTD